MIEILAGGALSSVQDRGRIGLRRLGVPRAGTLVPPWMSVANALVGNAPDAPVIECFEGGLRLRVIERPSIVAHAGDADVVALRDGARRPLVPWRAHRLDAGTEIAVRGSGRARLTVIAVRALAIPLTLGSASSYARAGLGGSKGRALAAGDRLAITECETEDRSRDGSGDGPEHDLDERFGAGNRSELHRGPPMSCEPFLTPLDEIVLRAVPGPQSDAFDDDELERFFATSWTLSSESDRMGTRLDGAAIAHRNAGARDIVSDAIVPGSVQVPGNGQPIIMLADAHTAGGYPKIATVISSDLPLLGLHRAGTSLRLQRVDVDEAIRHTRERAGELARHLGTLRPAPADAPDTARLLASNLIDGVTDGAAEPDEAPTP